jgi:hypothetical protein
MKVIGIDERIVLRERDGGNFILFVYVGGPEAHTSWSVDSYLFTEADLPSVWCWLGENLPVDSCWSLGVVEQPAHPSTDTEVSISWVVGGDVLNRDADDREPAEQQLAEEMLARRHRLTLT